MFLVGRTFICLLLCEVMTASNDVTLKSETTPALPEALLAEGESISDAQIERAISVIDAELYESPERC